MLIIYFTKDKKNYQTVRPTKSFDGNWKGLVDAITGSYTHANIYHKNYAYFEIL